MNDDEPVHFRREQHLRKSVAQAWTTEAALLRSLCPASDIQHVGSTAVPGSLTKGDLDIQVRVPAEAFARAEEALGRHYRRNAGSTPRPGFAAFEKHGSGPAVGIQLTTIGGELDVFWRFREVLLRRPELVAEYDALKTSFEGRPMSSYRRAKNEFFEKIRRMPEFWGVRSET